MKMQGKSEEKKKSRERKRARRREEEGREKPRVLEREEEIYFIFQNLIPYWANTDLCQNWYTSGKTELLNPTD